MLLQPRHFVYKRKQKNRSLLSFNSSYNQKYLKFGSSGLFLLRPAQLTSDQIFRFKLFLKKASKRSDYTRRFVWFHAFPHIPLTKKPTGTRMGKGKGKLECWFTNISGGSTLIEFKNLRYGRSKYFMNQMSHKLGIQTKSIFNSSLFLDFPIKTSKKIFFKTFW